MLKETDKFAKSRLYGAFKTRLISGFALLIVALAALLFWKIYAQYNSARVNAYTQTEGFARAMSAHVASEMRVVDLSLLRATEALDELAPAQLQDRAKVRQTLALSASVADSNFWVFFTDAQGRGVASSNNLHVAGVSFADRAYFSDRSHQCDSGLTVSAPENGRVSKRLLFFASRPVCSREGAFIGMVVAPIDASALAKVFSSAMFLPSLSITLMHGDGRLIARAPLFETSFAADVTGTDLYKNWRKAPSGSYAGRSIVDNKARVFSYRTVEQLPLVVSVGIATESWIQSAEKDSAVAASVLALVGLALWFSGRFALASFKRVESSNAGQRALNAQLAAARDETELGARRLRTIADSLPALIAYVDSDERYVFHNSFYRNFPEVDVDRMLGRTMREALGEEFYGSIKDRVAEALAGSHVWFERELEFGGRARHLKFDYTPDFDKAGAVVGFYVMTVDVTDAKNIEAALSEQARVDNLTGLPNRSQVYERLTEALARSRRSGAPIGCLYLDIDHFKSLNDTLGHAGGDEALKQFGARLRSCVRETDLVARLAGDEFVIVLEGLEQPEGAARVAQKIIAAMLPPFEIDGALHSVSASVGIAVSAGSKADPDSILRDADAALYRAKRGGRARSEAADLSLV